MTSTSAPTNVKRYLSTLNRSLGDLPAAQRRTIMQDISAHIEESRAAGRTDAEVLAGLGSPQALAQSSRNELGVAPERPIFPASTGTTLTLVAFAAGTVAALVISFYLRNNAGLHPDSDGTTSQVADSLITTYGPGIAVLTLLPALLVVLPLFVPARIQRIAALSCALAITVLVFASPFETGLFYAPLAMMAWLAATLPYASRPRAGQGEQLTVRLLGTILLLIPSFGLLVGLQVDNFGVEMIPLAIWLLLSLGMAAGYLCNLRAAYWAVLVVAVLLFGVALFDAGILIAAFCLAGGVYLVLSLYGLLRLNPKSR